MKYNWNSDKYIKLVERTSEPLIREHMDAEINIINRVGNPKEKTFIDVGAGYGRIIPRLSKIGKQVIAVEIDKNLLPELKQRANQHSNTLVIEGDAQNLSELLRSFDIQKPVLICFQNTLGTPIGDPFKILSEMIKVAKDKKGEIIISIFIQEGLKDYGIPIYSKISELIGEPDLEKTDFQKGIFISKTGYLSHWWRSEERTELAKIIGGTKLAEITGKYFYLLHIKY